MLLLAYFQSEVRKKKKKHGKPWETLSQQWSTTSSAHTLQGQCVFTESNKSWPILQKNRHSESISLKGRMKYATYQDNFFERVEIRSFSSCFQVFNYVLFFNTLETIFFCDIFIRSAIKNFLGLCSQKQRKDFWVAYEKKQNCVITSECCLNMQMYFDNSVSLLFLA